ncbi:MAG: SVM family protein [Candidatus Phytoplasma vitis]|nr:MAG: SVM family protein [Candidatus Phytoplasma vitis]
MFKLQNQFKIISVCLFTFLGFLFIINNNQVMAMKKQNSYINKKSKDINNELFNLLTNKKELEYKIHCFRVKEKLNSYERTEVLKLEIEHHKLKLKISEIYKNNSKMSKVTFNLKPLIKIIEN